nr:immunoglobulin heavy chain junction region [Mus musculus]
TVQEMVTTMLWTT